MTLCYSDIETREAIRRLKEVAFTFGSNGRNNCYDVSDVQLVQQFLTLLKEREFKRAKWYRKSPQIKYRRYLTEYIMRISTIETLTTETTYQAIYLLDRFMDQHDIAESQLPAVALVCIVLSGKLLEADGQIPKYRKLVTYLHGPKAAVYASCAGLEEYILTAFNFDILVPTEVSFLETYLLYVVDGHHAILDDDVNNNNNSTMPNANLPDQINVQGVRAKLTPFHSVPGVENLMAMNETSFLILQEITRQGGPDNKFSPSCIAAAIILASRREHGLNFWTPTLQTITSYNLEQLSQCLKEYVEPRIANVGLLKPFTPPQFVNVTFESFLVVDEEDV